MDEGTALTMFFTQIWRYFTLTSPFFGLKVWQILFGLTVCELGIGIFADFFTGLLRVDAPSREEVVFERQRAEERYKDSINRAVSRNKRYAYNIRNNQGWF